MADWAGLNPDLLISIAERLPSMESYESFSGVCKSWKAAATEGHLTPTIFEGPWLMFAEKDDEPREFCSISLGRNRTRKIFLPETNKLRCVSCKDWLFVTCSESYDTCLLHPLSRVQIHLPKLNTISFYDHEHHHGDEFGLFVHKVVISANPATNSDYIVMVICGGGYRLGFWKPGDTAWTSSLDIGYQWTDIIYSDNKKKFYCLGQRGGIYSCDIHERNSTQLLKVSDDFRIPPDEDYYNNWYLVELSGGKFLVVTKYMYLDEDKNIYHNTDRFRVFEVESEDGTWVEVNDLGNKALFLGYSTSFIIECSEFNKCKPNCIYYSDDFKDGYLYLGGGGKDMGIYCLSDGSNRSLFDDKIGSSMTTPPTWIGPSF